MIYASNNVSGTTNKNLTKPARNHLACHANSTTCTTESYSTVPLLPNMSSQFQGCTTSEREGHTNSKGAQPQGDGRPISKDEHKGVTTNGARKEPTPKVAPANLPQTIAKQTRAKDVRINPPVPAPVASHTRLRTSSHLVATAICLAN